MTRTIIIGLIIAILLSFFVLIGIRYFQNKLPSVNGVYGTPSVEGPKEAPPGR